MQDYHQKQRKKQKQHMQEEENFKKKRNDHYHHLYPWVGGPEYYYTVASRGEQRALEK